MLAQVNSTVDGLFITNVVFGSPSTVHYFYQIHLVHILLPIHSLSIVIPCSVSVVTIALIPVACPAFTVVPKVDETMSSL